MKLREEIPSVVFGSVSGMITLSKTAGFYGTLLTIALWILMAFAGGLIGKCGAWAFEWMQKKYVKLMDDRKTKRK